MTLGPHFCLAKSHPIVACDKHQLLFLGTDRISHRDWQQHWRISEGLSDEGCDWKSESKWQAKEVACATSHVEKIEEPLSGKEAVCQVSKSISEEMPVESMNIPKECFSCLVTFWIVILLQCINQIQSLKLFDVGLLACHVGGTRRRCTNDLTCTSCLKGALCKFRQWVRLVCLEEIAC